MLEQIGFRRWWQPPRAASEPLHERRVTYLELFYDLVYVVIIAELSHTLAENVSLAGIGRFVFLFIIVWWAWVNGTMYHDLHGNSDIRSRVFTFLQMFTVAAMAVFAHHALGEGSAGFALSYAAFHLILTWLWWRTGIHHPDHRPLSQPYSMTFLVTSLLFIISIFVPSPWRFGLWGLGLLADLLLLLLLLSSRNAAIQAQLNQTFLVSSSAVERFALFTLIVLGEVIVGVVRGVSGQPYWSGRVGGTAALGMVIAIGLWWLYFDFVATRSPIARPATSLAWLYLHLPVAIGTTIVGATVVNIIEHAGAPLPANVRWLLVGAIATVLIAIALIMRLLTIPESDGRLYQMGSILIFTAGLIVASLGLTQLGIIQLLLALNALLLTPVFYGLPLWMKAIGAQPQLDL